MPAAAVLVEGESDRAALEALAARRGRDPAGVTFAVMSGFTNVARELSRAGQAAPVAVLCDRGAERFVHRAVARSGTDAGVFVCDEDLEDELIRALGTDAVLRIVDSEGERDSLRRLRGQPAHRDGDLHSHLRRFLSSKAGRKERYAPLLVAALAGERIPEPLDGVLAHVGL